MQENSWGKAVRVDSGDGSDPSNCTPFLLEATIHTPPRLSSPTSEALARAPSLGPGQLFSATISIPLCHSLLHIDGGCSIGYKISYDPRHWSKEGGAWEGGGDLGTCAP
ncbi:hypothetical protein AAFF_G00037900 [Aldrovandia affinis]|uniref:Uncharacterized protein n=1 Tax=Aldrovandia affinis TaxID=143900 RepID=A0AAD7T5X2_9TELE|nr:hypothetical protein AAFF_G00037900 [Aldrovandia affinis]